ncbi:MAG TPA: transporter substrate-binding domain-containing protein [Candidatus Limnocylindria bacterium]|nr:transporter substrate-binding domain-containing protein [Candidatus Limnocylindria bacterium]
MRTRGLAVAALIGAVISGCVPPFAEPAPTLSPTADRPRFDAATYMYALQARGTIRIGVLDRDVPFARRDSGGGYVGFEPDLGRELAKALFGQIQSADSVIEWIPVDRSSAVPALAGGRTDVVIARLVADDERAAAADLTTPYFATGERILVAASNDEIKELPDLDTKTVCVQGDTGVAERVVGANAFARTLSLDTYASCLGALRAGQVDAIGADEATLWGLRRADADTKIVGRYLLVERYAIGVKKGSAERPGFLPFLDGWLAAVIGDGTWARLYETHIKPLSGETRTAPTR